MGKKSETKFNNDHIYVHILQIKQIQRLIVDASSLIYLDKLNLLNLLSQNLSLFTITDIISEIGTDCQSRAQVTILPPLSHDPNYDKLISDRKIVLQAIATKMPVLSDDGRIVRAGFDGGFTVYQAIFIVLWLHFNNIISQTDYWNARNQLADFALYAPKLLAQADQLLFMFGKYFWNKKRHLIGAPGLR